jgi:hypothetical protein
LPNGFSLFEPAVFFASGGLAIEDRIKNVKSADSAIFGDVFRFFIFSMMGGIVLDTGRNSMRFGGPMTTEDAYVYIQDNCEPGDIRIRHFVFRSWNVSVIAFKRGKELVSENVIGFQIGILSKWNVPSERMVEDILNKYNDDVSVQKMIVAMGWIVGVFIVIRDAKQRCMIFVILCWAIGMVRSLNYQSGILQPEYWGFAGLVIVPFIIQRFIR